MILFKVTGEAREVTWAESGQICSLQCFSVPEFPSDQIAEQVMTAYLCVMNKQTGNYPFICEPRQSSHGKEKLLLSMVPQYAADLAAAASH